MGESFDRAAHEVPRSICECTVEISDQVVLQQVEFDLAEKVGEEQRPEFARGQRLLGWGAFGRLSCGCFPGFTPSRGEDVLGKES